VGVGVILIVGVGVILILIVGVGVILIVGVGVIPIDPIIIFSLLSITFKKYDVLLSKGFGISKLCVVPVIVST
jgi:hypothetical protein